MRIELLSARTALRLSICALSLGVPSGYAQANSKLEESSSHRTINRDPTFQWPNNEESSATLHLGEWNVMDLLDSLFGDGRLGAKIYGLKDFRFARLTKTKMYLVALVDMNGRELFNNIVAIYCHSRRCEAIVTASFGDVDLRKQLIDSDKDGVLELVARDETLVYRDGPPFPIFTYRREILRGEDFVDVSSESREAWEKYVEPLMKADFEAYDRRVQSQLDMQRSRKVISERDRERIERATQELATLVACAKTFARSDAARRVYGLPDAGVEEAAGWLQSTFPEVRELGISTLITIDSSRSADVLRKIDLSKYPAWISSEAKGVIERRTPRNIPDVR